ncbi:hypothetical protein RUM43_001583 [Polyplax serrata]|uniref:Uncharacterized protein n=1 Tax=Polyplax serrata TaxID=468196 RepID=A0AAN8SI29_POLSC
MVGKSNRNRLVGCFGSGKHEEDGKKISRRGTESAKRQEQIEKGFHSGIGWSPDQTIINDPDEDKLMYGLCNPNNQSHFGFAPSCSVENMRYGGRRKEGTSFISSGIAVYVILLEGLFTIEKKNKRKQILSITKQNK